MERHVLEALRPNIPCAAVLITTDKYENKEWAYGYREVDPWAVTTLQRQQAPPNWPSVRIAGRSFSRTGDVASARGQRRRRRLVH
jgi:hypothetical protein